MIIKLEQSWNSFKTSLFSILNDCTPTHMRYVLIVERVLFFLLAVRQLLNSNGEIPLYSSQRLKALPAILRPSKYQYPPRKRNMSVRLVIEFQWTKIHTFKQSCIMTIIVIIIIIIIAFIQGIYNRIPETKHVYRVYNIAEILRLQILVHITSFFTSTFM
jgi:hypothetical protein